MAYGLEFWHHFWVLLDAIAMYMLLGLVIASILRIYISDRFIVSHMGGNTLGAVLKASLLGLPLPLCSCSVLPIATSLKKSGAGNGPVVSFLSTTPMTGVDSIIPTYGVFGGLITVLRVLVSLIIGLLAGIIVGFVERLRGERVLVQPSEASVGACSGGCQCTAAAESSRQNPPKSQAFGQIFLDLMGDIAKPLVIGLVLAALLLSVWPEQYGDFVSQHVLLSYGLALLLGLPLYVCSISVIPVAISLYAAGFSLGAAFIFLTAAPAVSMVSLSVLLRVVGLRNLLIFLACLAVGSIVFAAVIDGMAIEIPLQLLPSAEQSPVRWLPRLFSFVLIALCLYLWVGRFLACFSRQSRGCA